MSPVSRAPAGTIDRQLLKGWIDLMTPKQIAAVKEFIESGRLNRTTERGLGPQGIDG